MLSRLAAPVSKAVSTSARSISNTAPVARPSLALRSGYNANPLRQQGQAEEAAAGSPEASRPLTTSSIGAPHRPLSSAPARRPPMQGFRFIASGAAKPLPASRNVDCVVLPRLTAAPAGSVAPFARMIHVPYLPAKGSAPVVEAPYSPVSANDADAIFAAETEPAPVAAAAADAAAVDGAAAPPAPAFRAGRDRDGAAVAAKGGTLLVSAVNPGAVSRMTEIEGIGADGMELFASGVERQPRGWREPGMGREPWKGLVSPAFIAGGGASSTPSRSGAVPA